MASLLLSVKNSTGSISPLSKIAKFLYNRALYTILKSHYKLEFHGFYCKLTLNIMTSSLQSIILAEFYSFFLIHLFDYIKIQLLLVDLILTLFTQ